MRARLIVLSVIVVLLVLLLSVVYGAIQAYADENNRIKERSRIEYNWDVSFEDIGSFVNRTDGDVSTLCSVSGDGHYVAIGWSGYKINTHHPKYGIVYYYNAGFRLYSRESSRPLWEYRITNGWVLGITPVETDRIGQINTIKISEDGKYIAIGTDEGWYSKGLYDWTGCIHVFTPDSPVPVWEYYGNNDNISGITQIRFSSDGRYVVAGAEGVDWQNGEYYILLFSSSDGHLLWRHRVDGGIENIAISPDGEYIAAGGKGWAYLWDRNGVLLYEFHEYVSCRVDINKDLFVVFNDYGKEFIVLSLDTYTIIAKASIPVDLEIESSKGHIISSDDILYLVVCSPKYYYDVYVYDYNLKTRNFTLLNLWKGVNLVRIEPLYIDSIRYTPDGKFIAFPCWDFYMHDGWVELHTMRNNSYELLKKYQTTSPGPFTISNDGATVVVTSYDTQTVHVFYNDAVPYDWWWVDSGGGDISPWDILLSSGFLLGHVLPAVIVGAVIAVLVIVYRLVPVDREIFAGRGRHGYWYDDWDDEDEEWDDEDWDDEDDWE